MSEENVEKQFPTKAKLLKDIDGNIKEAQAELVVTITERGFYSVSADAILTDIEHLKRIKEALK